METLKKEEAKTENFGFTPEQLERQAGCFRLLSQRIAEHYQLQSVYPDFLKNGSDANDEAVGTIARWILEENAECLVKAIPQP